MFTDIAVDGNTPTCMGKTLKKNLFYLKIGKHPHVHGEDGLIVMVLELAAETPPRAWGRHTLDVI